MLSLRWLPTALLSLALAALYLGERVLESGTGRLVSSGLGVALLVAALGLRASRWSSASAGTRRVEGWLLALHLATAGGLVLYLAQSDVWAALTGALLSVGSPVLAGSLAALWPAVVLCSVVPALSLELSVASMARAPTLEVERASQALVAGLALSLLLVFAVSTQYVVTERDVKVDLSYFRVAAPGQATRGLLQSLDAPLEVFIFMPPASDVAEAVVGYFEELKPLTPLLKVTRLDHAVEPTLAKELGASGNGAVVFRRGERKESLFVGVELERARLQLRSLDQDVQKRLLQVARTQRTVYLTQGHGERLKDPLSPEDKRGTISILQRTLEDQNHTVRPLTAAEGLGQAVPSDAAAVMVVGPTADFDEAEAQALATFFKKGGRLFLLLDPEPGKDFATLLKPLGLTLSTQVLADDAAYARTRRDASLADRRNVVTRVTSSHPAVTYLSRTQQPLVVLGAGALAEAPGKPAEVAVDVVMRTQPTAFNDANLDGQLQAPAEVRLAYGLAAAVSRREGPGPDGKPGQEGRALVVSDSDFLADDVLPGVQGNQLLVLDGLKWLLGEEALQGATTSEQDVPLTRTKQQEQLWFYGTTVGVPLLVLAAGAWARRRPRRTGGAA